MAGASNSPCRRASTASSAVTTAVPSCSATVTAGVAVSKASSSTVEQRRSLDYAVSCLSWSSRAADCGMHRKAEEETAHGSAMGDDGSPARRPQADAQQT
jgi:hypothetical protein